MIEPKHLQLVCKAQKRLHSRRVVFASNDPLDIDYVRGWLRRIFPNGDPRLARLDRVVESEGRDLG